MNQSFTPGVYATRSIGDHNCIIEITVASRTAKTISTPEGKQFRVKVIDGIEHVFPWGKYSLCPMIGADDRKQS